MDSVRRPSPFLEQIRAAIRVRHYSIRTEESYLFWVRRFILFHGKRHPRELRGSEVGEFLAHLAVDRKVSASTQNQALNALVFLYKAVLERPLGDIGGAVRARRPQRLPVVLHVREIKALLRHLEGSHWLAACLMYGSGLRLMEALRLRVKGLYFEHRAIFVRDGKDQKDRVVTLADELIVLLQRHLAGVRLKKSRRALPGSEGGMKSPGSGMNSPVARMNSPLAGINGPVGGMKSPLAGVNGPLAGIRALEARMRHRIGGKRTPVGRTTGSEPPRDA